MSSNLAGDAIFQRQYTKMVWSDSGIVLSSRKHGENFKIVSIFTKEHGKVSAISKTINRNAFSLFSNVSVELVRKNLLNDMGFWSKKFEKQNWIYVFNEELALLVCQSICLILDKILPVGVKFLTLFSFLEFILINIKTFSQKEILILYAYFEFLLLHESGFGFDLDRCSICGQKERVKFISPKTGRTASENCCASYRDKLFEIPDVWFYWKNRLFSEDITNSCVSYNDLSSSLKITWYFINKNIIETQNHFRDVIISRFLGKQ